MDQKKLKQIADILDDLAATTEVVGLAEKTINHWIDHLDDMNPKEASATLMTITSTTLITACRWVEEVARRDGAKVKATTVCALICKQALGELLGEEGTDIEKLVEEHIEKRVDDLPTRKVKPGPSPWGL